MLKIQAIYSDQPTVDGSEANILNFLNSDDDTLPLLELQNRKSKIITEEFLKMEGLLTEDELTDTLVKYMKGASAPGKDGFTINWLR